MVRHRADRCSSATIIALRDYRVLERYRYTIAVGRDRAAAAAARAGHRRAGQRRLPRRSTLGPLTFQPAEFAKIAIVIFLASYLRDTRQLLVTGARRFAGITLPPLKHFGPLLVVWGAAMLMLFFIQDLGSSLMFFGGVPGAALRGDQPRLVRGHRPERCSPFGALGPRTTSGRPSRTASTPGCTRSTRTSTTQVGGSYQIAQSLFAQADGGIFGRGFGQALLELPGGTPLLPAAQTDLIYAVIANELGLVGACAVLLHLPAHRRSAASRSRCSRATRSPSCWRPA